MRHLYFGYATATYLKLSERYAHCAHLSELISQSIKQARLFTKANRDLIPVVKKWFKPDYVTGNEQKVDAV